MQVKVQNELFQLFQDDLDQIQIKSICYKVRNTLLFT